MQMQHRELETAVVVESQTSRRMQPSASTDDGRSDTTGLSDDESDGNEQ